MSDTQELRDYVYERLHRAKATTGLLGMASTAMKNSALERMAEALWDHRDAILAANAEDVAEAKRQAAQRNLQQGAAEPAGKNGSAVGAGAGGARIDRLRLTEERIMQMMVGLRQLVDLADPVGDILETSHRPNGLEITKVRVPMGVIAMVYEARPNVTVDAAGLALKTGNAIVLRGGREALKSNQALVAALHEGLESAGLPRDAVQLIERVEHASVDLLIQARGLVNLAIPRGGAGLIQRVVENARVPVIETGVGNCHVYVDTAANLDKALPIILNAKTQRPSVCNAAETLLVHQSIADRWLPKALEALVEAGVEVRACPRTMAALKTDTPLTSVTPVTPLTSEPRLESEIPTTSESTVAKGGIDGSAFDGAPTSDLNSQPNTPTRGRVVEATADDWDTEYLDLVLAVKVVDSLEDAILHIAKHGTQHSESIVTEDQEAANCFLAAVDAAVVYHNASTRFTDGFEFGYGAEIGISTQKLHARGPMGLRELTTYKFVIRGNGQIRE